jgi:hypothetical protein
MASTPLRLQVAAAGRPAAAARAVRPVSGLASRDKILEVAGVPPAEIEAGVASAERKDP